jgi:hypothetical protein
MSHAALPMFRSHGASCMHVRQQQERIMIIEETSTRCAHAPCTCHAQAGEQYCSESCRTAAESTTTAADTDCSCGHAGCAATEYASGQAKSGDAARNPRRTSGRSH